MRAKAVTRKAGTARRVLSAHRFLERPSVRALRPTAVGTDSLQREAQFADHRPPDIAFGPEQRLKLGRPSDQRIETYLLHSGEHRILLESACENLREPFRDGSR